MRRLSLSQRLSAVFAVLLLACCGASLSLQMLAGERHEQEVVQRLSRHLAEHVVGSSALLEPQGPNPAAVNALFGRLMDVNPSAEVYLLGPQGDILAQAAPPGHVKLGRVDLGPVRRLLAGDPLPILGDDPRHTGARKVFSAAALRMEGELAGYVYVVLRGEDHDAMANSVAGGSVWKTTLWAMGLVTCLGLLAGLLAFRWITRPLQRLAEEVGRFDIRGPDRPAPAGSPVPDGDAPPPGADEIDTLRRSFANMTSRIAAQWQELNTQDQQRRELVANISHDLRTPLTSLHGYLETLKLKADSLSQADRLRYLDVALSQSRKVERLAQSLFELARLEHGAVKPELERCSLADLVQDVFQKFELAAETRGQLLLASIAPDLPVVEADVAMIERVLTNLLDNAIRHTPDGGQIKVQLNSSQWGVEVCISDSGPGIPPALRDQLFRRPPRRFGWRGSNGGLGLLIVRRILQLHGSDIRLDDSREQGAMFRFLLGGPRAAEFTEC
jgi:signal transduction histidine kinase